MPPQKAKLRRSGQLVKPVVVEVLLENQVPQGKLTLDGVVAVVKANAEGEEVAEADQRPSEEVVEEPLEVLDQCRCDLCYYLLCILLALDYSGVYGAHYSWRLLRGLTMAFILIT